MNKEMTKEERTTKFREYALAIGRFEQLVKMNIYIDNEIEKLKADINEMDKELIKEITKDLSETGGTNENI